MGCEAVVGRAVGSGILITGVVFLVYGLVSREFADNRMNWMTIAGIVIVGLAVGLALLSCIFACCYLGISKIAEAVSSKSSTNQPQASFNQSSTPYGEGSTLSQSRSCF